jgi:hypothetical protein
LILIDLLNLVKLRYEGGEDDGALEFGVEEETHEEERVVEATHVFKHAHHRVDISSVDVHLLVHLEHLEEVEALAWACVGLGHQVSRLTELVEVVVALGVEETEEVVVELEGILLVPDDRLDALLA